MSMKSIKFILLIGFVLVGSSLMNCRKSTVPRAAASRPAVPAAIPSRTQQASSAVTQSTQQSAQQSTEMSATTAYYYNPAGKTDPFEPFDISKIKPTTAVTPLQQFSLDQLTVRGIIWGVSNAKAIIEDPTGKTYIVGTGTKMGKNNGVIIRIMNDKVVVLEQYTDVFTGKVKTNEVTMALKKTEKI